MNFKKDQLLGWSEDATVDFYANNRNSYDALYKSEKHFLTKDFVSSVESVLDMGCACGGFYNIFKYLNPKIKYTGVDVSPSLLEVAKSKISDEDAEFHLYEGTGKIPVSGKFDLVYCSGILHLIDNWKELFSELTNFSKKFALADFRTTPDKTCSGAYIFDYDHDGVSSNSTNYHAININELLEFFKSLETISKIEVCAYPGKCNDATFNLNCELWMAFFKFTLGKRKNGNIEIVNLPAELHS
jgi:SAM-dependent methyltransferase